MPKFMFCVNILVNIYSIISFSLYCNVCFSVVKLIQFKYFLMLD